MKHLTLTLEEEICILDKYRLTSDELLVLRVLLILQNDGNEELFRDLLNVSKQNNTPLRNTLLSLQEKEIILKSYKVPEQGVSFDPYTIPINKNFVKNLYRSSFEMGKELFDEYPQFGYINGTLTPLRGISKKFDSLEHAYFKYSKAINFSPSRHKAIIELVKWANENNILNCSLATFIVDQKWNDLDALKNDKDSANINFDTIRML